MSLKLLERGEKADRVDMADDIAAPELKGEADLLSSLYPDELLYYVSTPQHLATILIFDLIVFATTYLTTGWKKAGLSPENRKPRKQTTLQWVIEMIFAVTLIISLILQTYYKAKIHLKYTAHMLAPCHAVSTLYIYILLQKDYIKATTMWNITLFFSFYPMLALISMDGTDFIFPGMCEVSYAQHIVLAILPFYLLWVDRLPIEKHRLAFFQQSMLTAVLFCWNIQLPVALVSKINVNYMLWPPPAAATEFLGGELYQFKFCLFFATFHAVAGYGFPAFTSLLKTITRVILSPFSGSKKTEARKKKK